MENQHKGVKLESFLGIFQKNGWSKNLDRTGHACYINTKYVGRNLEF